jgi:hypothetical protein
LGYFNPYAIFADLASSGFFEENQPTPQGAMAQVVCRPESSAAVTQPIERGSCCPPAKHTIQHFNIPIDNWNVGKASYCNFSIPKVSLFLLPQTSGLKPNAVD